MEDEGEGNRNEQGNSVLFDADLIPVKEHRGGMDENSKLSLQVFCKPEIISKQKITKRSSMLDIQSLSSRHLNGDVTQTVPYPGV